MLCIASARPHRRTHALVHAQRRRTPTFPTERSRTLDTSHLGARVRDGIPPQPRLAPRSRASRLLRPRSRARADSRRVRRRRIRTPSRFARSPPPSRARVSRPARGRGPRRSNPAVDPGRPRARHLSIKDPYCRGSRVTNGLFDPLRCTADTPETSRASRSRRRLASTRETTTRETTTRDEASRLP